MLKFWERRDCQQRFDCWLIAERGISAYVAAKHAVIGLSKAAAIVRAAFVDGRWTKVL
jgi:NAD(P)-dependent dehydrogenase (short-subunit alcohol dehydrogenase family)